MEIISHRALAARINRRLNPEGEGLRTCSRNRRWWSSLGDYYIHDYRRNFITHPHVNLEDLGREMGCLAEDEALREEAA
jgi:hypothetical protein